MNIIAFAGQGSQKKGIGENLFEKYSHLMSQVNETLGYSVNELILNDEFSRLNITEFSQPAIYVLNHLYYLDYLEGSPQIDTAIGHSLGEYNALVAGGVLSFLNGLKLVQMRGHLMNMVKNGGMSAIIGLSADDLQDIINKSNLPNVQIANYNTHTQNVISGDSQQIEQLCDLLQQNARSVRLNASGAFHSTFMKSQSDYFKTYLSKFEFSKPKITVYSNAYANIYTAEESQKNLYNQIYMPVKWTAIMRIINDAGITSFHEIGHSTILSNMLREFS